MSGERRPGNPLGFPLPEPSLRLPAGQKREAWCMIQVSETFHKDMVQSREYDR
jgi:hypothetical protein